MFSRKIAASGRPDRTWSRYALAVSVFLIVLSTGAPQTWVQDTIASPSNQQHNQVVVSFDVFDPALFEASAFAD